MSLVDLSFGPERSVWSIPRLTFFAFLSPTPSHPYKHTFLNPVPFQIISFVTSVIIPLRLLRLPFMVLLFLNAYFLISLRITSVGNYFFPISTVSSPISYPPLRSHVPDLMAPRAALVALMK